jgi:Tc toxin complex TcA C-terminal TcB-binding domain
MSGVLENVYASFLQQSTSLALLAQNQLAFERQETPLTYVQKDYWLPPTEGFSTDAKAPDRKGLTGSARLLRDIYELDRYAFDTNKRKLQLVKTISLALLSPAEFQRFIETGVLIFAIPMDLFDRDFPGHYLRLIRRVRTSVIALIPPIQGIKATLTSSGLTRTVIGSDIFQTTSIRRDPEFVALTSPSNSSGVFELESLQPEFLLPFEGNGVDSTWEFRMPKASNQFDYRSIADVLITIEYTALNSFDYRQQVIQTLNPNLSADRPFSFRNQFADQWYDLNNSEQSKTPMKVKFQTIRQDFPPNVETRASQKTFELPITELRFTEQGSQGTVGGTATPIDGIISTRRGNSGSWTSAIGKTPVGEWELTLPNTEEVRKHFQNEELDDILFVITYSGRTPEWPS